MVSLGLHSISIDKMGLPCVIPKSKPLICPRINDLGTCCSIQTRSSDIHLRLPFHASQRKETPSTHSATSWSCFTLLIELFVRLARLDFFSSLRKVLKPLFDSRPCSFSSQQQRRPQPLTFVNTTTSSLLQLNNNVANQKHQVQHTVWIYKFFHNTFDIFI